METTEHYIDSGESDASNKVESVNTEVPPDVPADMPKKVVEAAMKKQTLYELLGANPTDTREEIKKKYILLAKMSHPDAQIGRNGTVDGTAPDFGEISQAWRVLGDAKMRLRYDRSLRAEAFSENAQRIANERLEKAVPAVAEMLDKVALPFLRRTTATTWAVAQAASKGLSSFTKKNRRNNTQAIAGAFVDAIQAGQRAGRVIDSLELFEKSEELFAKYVCHFRLDDIWAHRLTFSILFHHRRAAIERAKADQIAQELNATTETRLFATLQTPNFALSSDEAKLVLECLDPGLEESVSILNRALLRKSIEEEIDSLMEAELNFSGNLIQYEVTDKNWNELLKEQENVKRELAKSKEAEIEARKALEAAQRAVEDAKLRLVDTSNALWSVEQQLKRNAAEMDRVTGQLSRRQERVRSALRRKWSETVGGENGIPISTEEDVIALRRKEMKLAEERNQIEGMVARLQSRAETLRTRAQALEEWQKNGNNVQAKE